MAHYDTDYDLAILGGGISSRLAASIAAQRGARVALIAPSWQTNNAQRYTLQALQTSTQPWATLRQWVQHQCHRDSSAALMAQGIDVIPDTAQFTEGMALTLEHRHLKANRYLLTDGYRPTANRPNWPGILQDKILLSHQLMELETLPSSMGIIGHGATAVEWAWALSQRTSIKLLLLDHPWLPAEDKDIQRLSAAQFRQANIDVVLTQSSQLHTDVQQKNMEPGDMEPGDIDQWIIVPQSSTWNDVNLKQIGMEPDRPLSVNRHLQTAHPRIYVSGSSLGGENRLELTQQETAIVLDNALFERRRTIAYEHTAYSIHLTSPMGHWGLTERQAKQRYGGIQTFQSSCLPPHTDDVAQTNYCKLIVLGQRLIGAHLLGPGAPTLAAALGSQPNLSALSTWTTASFRPDSLHSTLYQATEQWQGGCWAMGQWRRDWGENWFNWRRSQ